MLTAIAAVREVGTHANRGEQKREKRGGMTALLGLFLLGLTVLMFGIMIAARTNAAPEFPELPQHYRPGNPLPSELSCGGAADGQSSPCFTVFEGYKVYFDFDADTRMILNSLIPVESGTLGAFVLSWGTPTGIRQTSYSNYVYWGSRAVLVRGNSLEPESAVQSIVYSWSQPDTQPWHGFRG